MKYAAALLLITNIANAELIKGDVKVGDKEIAFVLETQTGDYSMDINKLIRPEFRVSYLDNKKPNCEGEENFAEVAGSDLPVSDYSFNRGEIEVELKLVEEFDEHDVEEQIRRRFLTKTQQLMKLTNTTSFFVEDILLSFQWEPGSIVRKTKVPLLQSVERDANNQIAKAASERLSFKTKVHSFICDLQEGDVKVSVGAKVKIYNRIQRAGALSSQQVQILHQNLKRKEKTYNLNSENEESLVKAVRASAVLALETKALGTPENFVVSKKYLSLFREMFRYGDYKVSDLVNNDYLQIANNLAVDSEAQTEEVIRINQIVRNVKEQ